MIEQRDLLIEIGTEELPPKALKKLSDAFTSGILEGLNKAELNHASVKAYATPRRLALLVHNLDTFQSDRAVEKRGPALQAAFDGDGNPTKATEGFARSCDITVNQLEKLETDKGAWLVYRSLQQGQPTAELIPTIVQESLNKLPIPKRMRWGNLEAEFVRPVHWLVLLFGDDVIDAEILTVKSGRDTCGHRFHHPDPIYLGEPAAYAPILETSGHVIADFADRREAIRAQVMEVAEKNSGVAVIDEELLDEVTGLVEWPLAVVGSFEPRFLEVPPECLISAMKGHQKYFHMIDATGSLMPNFITVSNIESRRPEYVREGNERVIRPRLTDADFFWTQDKKLRLEDHLERLKTVLFQSKLGSVYDKSLRVSALAEHIARLIGGDSSSAARAALLAKCDLMTNMVFEFTELQGIMGRYYAIHDGEEAEVAAALDEQYMPRFAGDELPAGKVGQALAIAEKLDTLVGIFGIGQLPSGDKDPFALRRAALGALRIIIEKGLGIDLKATLEHAAETHIGLFDNPLVINQVFDFMMTRLKAYYADSGVAPDTFEAVLALQPTQPLDFDARIRAVTAFRQLPEAGSLAAANKRIGNILKKAEQAIPDSVDPAHFTEAAEQALATKIEALSAVVTPLFAARDYAAALKALAALRPEVDAFFDAVMVMADDPVVRTNRLALLRRLSDLFLKVADLGQLQS
ncbi:MAG: glycine--tRNA ligase subunit beta [Gammaproteobacteria bacterium]|nr:glycine--tRNA ligase subunit beta [Gammaproteobacteria bacterium]